MIITITGKPCSGKSVAIAYLMGKYGFAKFSAGDIYRKIATDRGLDVLELSRKNDFTIDKLIDDEIVEMGKRDLNKNIIFDSRTAWHFIPESFKVFLDIDEDEQVRRLKTSGRTNEKTDLTYEEAKNALSERWNLENDRYLKLYNFDNRNPENYNLVIDTTHLTVDEVAEKIYEEYTKYVSRRMAKK